MLPGNTPSRARRRVASSPPITRFARSLLTFGSGETPWLIVAFVLGVIAVGVVSNFVYSAAVDPASLTGDAGARVTIAVVLLVALAYAAYRVDVALAWQARRLNFTFDEKRIAPPHAGLIWLLSPGALNLPIMAIRHHALGAGGEPLRHCWLLITPGAREAFERLAERVSELGYGVALHPVHLPAVTIESSYRAVERVYGVEAGLVGLQPDQIIADLTGGLKPMTAGMVLACLPYGRTLEYIESEHDDMGRPIEGTQAGVRVGVDFRSSVNSP